MRTTIATALAAIIASLVLAAGPASAADKPAARTLRVEAVPKADTPTAALIRAERARLQTLRAQRKAERAAAKEQRDEATLARLRQQIAALESRSAAGK